MARRGKYLRFEEEEVQDLVDVSYGDKRAFCLLSLLYPTMDLRNRFHIDHVFPYSRFKTDARLAQEGVAPDGYKAYRDRANRLANLQLLEGTTNQEKSDRLPREWIEQHYGDVAQRQAYLDRHDSGDVPAALSEFCCFYDAVAGALEKSARFWESGPKTELPQLCSAWSFSVSCQPVRAGTAEHVSSRYWSSTTGSCSSPP